METNAGFASASTCFDAVAEALEKHRFAVSVFPDAASAAAYLDAKIDATTVAFGGSQTLEQLGLAGMLASHNELHWHQHPGQGMDRDSEREMARSTEVYISSANALAETGEIVNIDGAGNRVSSLFYGHGRIFYVIGRNKLAPSLEEAIARARNVAAPLNTRRLERKTPCALGESRCYDCRSPERICRGLAVMWEPMLGTTAEVVLIDEDLGF